MNIDINKLNKIRTMPLYVQVLIAAAPSLVFILIFVFLIYMPKNKQIAMLQDNLIKVENEILRSETKIKRLDSLIAENRKLKKRLAELRRQLPEEKEVSVLLKQISELGLQSGLEILLWKPEPRRVEPEGLYVEIPVKVEVLTRYHSLGDFFSKISRLPRLVNIKDITLSTKGRGSKKMEEESGLITAEFTALTFASASPQDIAQGGKGRKR
jgi:type IV pilus assembly protein PilO